VRGSIHRVMSERGTWLCPTLLHRMRLLDMEAKLARPRAIMYGSLAVVFVISIPWFGWVPFLPLVGSILGYSLLRPRISTSERPEYVVAATVLNAQILIGVGIALTGGANSPAIPFILLPLVTLPARFSTRGVYAGLAVTAITLLCGTVGVDFAGFVDNPTYVFAGLATAGGLTAFANFLMNAEMEQRSDSVLDPLTGLLNRKSLLERFEEIAQQAALTDAWVCVLACDLDHFKRVNDAHGHGRGDEVLKDAAHVLRKQLRSFELLYRLGGEEFLVVLPGLTLGEGRDVAERARIALEDARPGGLALTASMGVAAAHGTEVAYDDLFRAADRALYEAKRSGRNRVVASGDMVETQLAGDQARRRAA
jgi:diguanylate cyclase (GGDEF)-like protein